MYSGFKLTFNSYDEHFYKMGLSLYEEYQKQVRGCLNNYVGVDGVLNGSQIQQDWFPQIDADVFISHSHKDEKVAITLAGMLSKIGLKVFIDSCIWGYSGNLLKSIDNRFCLNESGTTYSYEERNKSTAHVHMMLSTALNMMIDKVESIFFLNTPNSVTSKSVMEETTSPWIYAEIAMTKTIAKRPLNDYRADLIKSINESVRMFARKDFKMKYKLDTLHLVPLQNDDLIKWIEMNNFNSLKKDFALDVLYDMIDLK